MLSGRDQNDLSMLGDQITEAVLAGDWQAYANLHTDDAVRYSPTFPPMKGRAEILAAFEGLSVKTFTQTVEAIDGDDNIGVVTASYFIDFTMDGHAEPIQEHGHVVASVRRQTDGRWLITTAMTTPDPMPDSQSA